MTVTWSGTSGDWNTPTLWSGTIAPTGTDDVSIAGSTGTVTISAGQSLVAAALALDGGNLFNSGPTLALGAGGTLNVAGSIVLGGAEIDLAGVLQGTLTAPPPPGVFVQPLPTTGTLLTEGGTLIGAIDVSAGEDIVVSGSGLNLLSSFGTTGQINDDGLLEFDGTQTLNNVAIAVSGDLSGNGELVAGAPFFPFGPPSSLTLGPNVLVTVAGGNLEINVNQGVVDVVNPAIANRYADSLDASFSNEGTVDAASGTRVNLTGGTAPINAATGLIVAEAGAHVALFGGGSTVVNAGTITLATGAIVTFDGTEDLTGANPFANFGTIDNLGGTIVLAGTFSHADQVLRLSDLTSRYDSVALTGTIAGGTVIADENIVPSNDFVLDSVIWDGSIVSTGIVSVLNDVSLHALDGTGQGFIDATAPGAGISLSGSLASALVAVGNATTATAVSVNGTLGADVTLTATSPGAVVIINTLSQDQHIQTPPVSMVNQGVIDAAAAGGSLTINDGAENLGTIIAENGDTVRFTQNQGATAGTLRLATGGTIVFEGSAPSSGTIDFADASATLLKLSDVPTSGAAGYPAAIPVIAGFQAGNGIDLPGDPDIALPGTDYAASFVSGSIEVTIDGTLFVDIPVAPGNDYTTDRFAFKSDGGTGVLVEIACFLPGTLIRTDKGEVAVEALTTGDSVVTLDGNRRPICWIGRGKALATRGRRGAATPIIVQKSALADNVPHTDLRITKGHALYIDDVLIPAEFLVNHRSIHWDDRAQEVAVFHLELDAHDIIVANGAAVESYRDDGNRWLFQNASTGRDQPPKPLFAPVLTGGPLVDAAWQRLLNRCGPRNPLPLTRDPDLCLLRDGVRIDPTTRQDNVHVFTLRGIPGALRIATRAAVPQELGVARDPRSLGVAVRLIAVRQNTRFRLRHATDPDLTDGFYPFEASTGLRWTNGDAVIPDAMFTGLTGPCEVIVHLSATSQYIDDGKAAAVA